MQPTTGFAGSIDATHRADGTLVEEILRGDDGTVTRRWEDATGVHTASVAVSQAVADARAVLSRAAQRARRLRVELRRRRTALAALPPVVQRTDVQKAAATEHRVWIDLLNLVLADDDE